jgi:hypothetical protein
MGGAGVGDLRSEFRRDQPIGRWPARAERCRSICLTMGDRWISVQ